MMSLMTDMKMRFASSCDFAMEIFKKKNGSEKDKWGSKN